MVDSRVSFVTAASAVKFKTGISDTNSGMFHLLVVRLVPLFPPVVTILSRSSRRLSTSSLSFSTKSVSVEFLA